MITFSRQSLIQSQQELFLKNYKNINFFIWLLGICTTIVSAVVVWFFSIALGLWLQAAVLFGSAIYYLLMSFIKERVLIGYYQRAKQLTLMLDKDGLAIHEYFLNEERIYFALYSNIYIVREFEKFIIIKLENEHFLTLPNTKEGKEFFEGLQKLLGNKYKLCK